MFKKKVLIPLPSYGFDPSESAIPWKLLTMENIEVQFSTPFGKQAAPDRIMLKGEKLGIWKSVFRRAKMLLRRSGKWKKRTLFENL